MYLKRPIDTLHAYAEQHTEAPSTLLAQIEQDTHAQVPMPQMLSGHLQGRFLALFSRVLRPRCILEIGTYTGYATLCLAEGLHPEGVLHTIDKNSSLEDTVRGYFERSGKAHQIQYYLGEAVDILPHLDEVFDLVFIDADKRHNVLYYEAVVDRVRAGGLIIVDNVLWSGKVLSTDKPMDQRTQSIRDFNSQVHRDPRVANLLLPLRDGLMILRKK
jgi:caffeoyl-CoA O-methyltransferase